jgi:hypothetical protein
MVHWDAGILVPLGALAMTVIIVGINTFRKMRDRELQAHAELRQREMEHERRLKELEIERLKLEVEKGKAERVS